MGLVSKSQMTKRIQRLRKKFASQAEMAEHFECSPQHMNDVVHGKRSPGPNILRVMGLKRVVAYAPESEDE